MKREPVAIINAIIALIEAGIAVAVGFGLDWSGEQVTPLADPRNAQGVGPIPESPAS